MVRSFYCVSDAERSRVVEIYGTRCEIDVTDDPDYSAVPRPARVLRRRRANSAHLFGSVCKAVGSQKYQSCRCQSYVSTFLLKLFTPVSLHCSSFCPPYRAGSAVLSLSRQSIALMQQTVHLSTSTLARWPNAQPKLSPSKAGSKFRARNRVSPGEEVDPTRGKTRRQMQELRGVVRQRARRLRRNGRVVSCRHAHDCIDIMCFGCAHLSCVQEKGVNRCLDTI